MPRDVLPATLSFLFEIGSTFGLIDVREPGEYNTAHIPGSTLLPRRLIEFRIARLLPFRGDQVILCDDDGSRAMLAARTLESFGYTRVAVLQGGLNRWASEGRPTEWGTNVLSKEFGERIEVQHHVPTIAAADLARRQAQGEELLILDTRTPEEFSRACIPGGRSVPGGELALRVTDIAAEHPNASVVVNCAGRTRSIIGARTLQRMGVPNVVSLRNGTSGWTLAGLELEHGSQRIDLPAPSAEGREVAEAFAEKLASEDGVTLLNVKGLRDLTAKSDAETVYLIDVRNRDEFLSGHIPGFWWFAGGQAVQRADDVAPIRNAAIVFACDGLARAAITASWYRQMGFPNVYALRGGTKAWVEAGLRLEQGAAEGLPLGLEDAMEVVHGISPGDLSSSLSSTAPPLVVFVDASDEFAAGHIPGARWLSRSRLELDMGDLAADFGQRVIVTDRNSTGALLAVQTLLQMGYRSVWALEGGMNAWRAAGLALEQGLSGVMSPPSDVVPAGPDRTYADMIHYLTWEEALGTKYAEA